jgi:hypothetical protein
MPNTQCSLKVRYYLERQIGLREILRFLAQATGLMMAPVAEVPPTGKVYFVRGQNQEFNFGLAEYVISIK